MNFCTVFDENYQAKGLSLIASIERWCPDSEIFVLAASDQFVPNADVQQTLSGLEHDCPELLTAKASRTHTEYMWTLASFWTWHLMNHQGLNAVCYVDADTFFFYDPQSLGDEIGDKAIAITEHRWTPVLKQNLESNGRFNVGIVYFKQAGLPCLTHWKDQVLDWCYYRHDEGDTRFGDQVYLDDWVDKWDAYVIQSNGVNLAPWNNMRYEYCIDENGVMFVQDGDRCDPIILFHFSEFDTYCRGKKIWTNYQLHPMVSRYLYAAYQAEITKWSGIAERTYA